MALIATFEIKQPDEMEATMHITMKVKEWRHLKEHIRDGYISDDLKDAIRELINQTEAKFFTMKGE